jgi:uncharacterized protein with von Willebrand factor type A (vWA) domain
MTSGVTGDGAATLVGFARTLRAAGVDATPDRVHQTVLATEHLDPARRRDLYWAGRLTLCSGPEDLERDDRASPRTSPARPPRHGGRCSR